MIRTYIDQLCAQCDTVDDIASVQKKLFTDELRWEEELRAALSKRKRHRKADGEWKRRNEKMLSTYVAGETTAASPQPAANLANRSQSRGSTLSNRSFGSGAMGGGSGVLGRGEAAPNSGASAGSRDQSPGSFLSSKSYHSWGVASTSVWMCAMWP